MLQEQIAALELPDAILTVINNLLRGLDTASTVEDLERERAYQIRLIRDLEVARRLRPAVIETLFMSFDSAVQQRHRELVDQP